MGRSLDIDDPLTAAIAPPPNESPEERETRLHHEREAKRVSDEIDEALHKERAAMRRKKKPVKVLLLGQSESGKSTTLKNFQLTYARNAWQEERDGWRSVIQLNLLRSVNTILDLLQRDMSSSGYLASPVSSDSEEEDESRDATRLQFTETHKLLKLRLAPLRRVQKDLERRIGAGSQEPTDTGASTVAAPQEFYVRSTTGWKTALDKLRPRNSTGSREEAHGRELRERESEETTAIIAGCRDDMAALWQDPTIRQMLTRRKLRLEDSAGFFLDDVERVASLDYSPSDDDIVRARLRTMGVQEYRFFFEKGSEAGQEWWMYDVGGTRSLRPAWASYFDDVNAIIFLAPINCFDEKLAEDKRVNRLEDSFLLWKAVCSSKLLSKTQLVLFLNKCDLLDKKLRSGVMVKDFVPSFGDRSNTLGTVAKYMRTKFRDMSKQYSPEPRPIYAHLTSVVDTKATALTLGAVREGILRNHLRGADFL
ncbi:G-alpha-domain-containing protein [Fomitiporia mediterranea MF3/22]|uniref:G-alpha-domain-containing protein n=1 Tax=Fomitiporia mediterranea (strain MF3/22) TaxID=694068 RepID=UPI0004408ED5|nr:G-alpha-domain-containing protein [Fomitiporia mediterranea MF3/22]EJD04654.1 G-alpha-domain-containing protein [Fomitiporia mediterranea MF3/22]